MGTVEKLGDYTLIGEAGRGATAVVHLALDGLGREVAVKELRPEFAAAPDARHRLAREISAQGRVRSRYVARLLGGSVQGDRPYAAMQHVPGITLHDLVSAYGPLSGAPLLHFARQLALGLADVHGAGVVHRDLTPRNVMVLGGSPVIIDFGVAQHPGTAQATRPGLLVGTPAFLAPEIIEGEQAAAASDVFSWAATVAFTATGYAPFGTGSLHAVCFRILRGVADLAGINEPLASLLRLGLRRDPAARPAARWFAASLAQWCGEMSDRSSLRYGQR